MLRKGKETLLIFRDDDDILQDTGAEKVEGLIISDAFEEGLALRRRAPTPTLIHLEPMRGGVPRSKVVFESGSAVDPAHDAKYVFHDAFQIWKSGAKTAQNARTLLANNRLKAAWVAIGFAFMIGCLIYVGVTGDVSVSETISAAR